MFGAGKHLGKVTPRLGGRLPLWAAEREKALGHLEESQTSSRKKKMEKKTKKKRPYRRQQRAAHKQGREACGGQRSAREEAEMEPA